MALDKIRQYNFDFLNKLKGGEKIGMDKSGRLYVLQPTSKFSAFFKNTFETLFPDAKKEQLAKEYAVAEFSKKDFINSEDTFFRYQKFMDKLIGSGLITTRNQESIATLYYNARFGKLIASGCNAQAAEAIIALEKSQDRFLTKKPPLPVATVGGAGGSYFIKNEKGETLAVLKPQDEEYGMPNNPKGAVKEYNPQAPLRGILREGYVQGTGWQREVAARAADYNGYIGVPFTIAVNVPFPGNPPVYKKGSLQLFAKGANVIQLKDEVIRTIPDEEVQKIAVFDLCTHNMDRNPGNMLYDQPSKNLTPIDHGLCFGDNADWTDVKNSEIQGDWLKFPQVKKPINEKPKKWVLEYPVDEVCQKLRAAGMSEGSIRSHRLSMIFMKEGVRQGFTIEQLAELSMGMWGKVAFFDKMVMQTLFVRRMGVQNEPLFYEAFQAKVSEELRKVKENYGKPD